MERSAAFSRRPESPTDATTNPGLWINLYLPSTIRWQAGSTTINLTQTTDYPLADHIHLQISTDHPTRFPLRLRVPAWCPNPMLSLNGHSIYPATASFTSDLASRISRERIPNQPGWATLDRLWHNNDQLTLHLPATLRLEPFPAGNLPQPPLAALCYGPLVLAADQPTTLNPTQLQTLQRTSPTEWLLPNQNRTFRPLFAVGDSTYTTYLQTT